MIPLLFKVNATEFVPGKNIGIFDQAISCEVTEEINGAFELHMEIIQNDPNLSNIEIGSIILARPNQTSGNQAFVIEQIVKSIDGKIEIYATHIAQYRAKLIPVKPFTATSLADTLTKIPTYSAESNPFTFATDKTVATNFVLSEPRSMRDLMGGVEGSILDIYKGEYFYSNFDIYLYNRRGRDVNIKVLYGSNMTKYVQTDEFNWSQSITGILPYYKKTENDTETVVVGDVQYSDYVDYYSYKKTIPYDFSMDFGETVPTKAQLNARAVSMLQDKGLPTVSINVSFEDLSTLPMFRSLYDNVENLQLGDTVNVINSQYNTNFKSRIRRLEYDVLMDRYNTIQIGDKVETINDAISGVLVTENTNEFISYSAGSGIDITNNVISAKAGTGISVSGGTISNVFNTLANPDLDEITYNYQGHGYGCTNAPTGESGNGQICVIARPQGDYVTQLYFPFNSTRIYIRKRNNGTWGDWVILANGYLPGDSITNSNSANNFLIVIGYLRTATSISFTIPLGKPVGASVTGVSFSSLTINVRNSSGNTIVNNIDVANNSNYTISAKLSASGINIALTIPSTSVTVSVPVSVLIGNMTATFS